MRKTARISTVFLLALMAFSIADATSFLNYSKKGFELDSVYNDDIFIVGNTIKFDSEVDGDLFSACSEVVQLGSVGGGFNAFAGSIESLGDVGGSFRAFGNEISLNAGVGRNFLAFGNKVTTGPSTEIKRDLEAYCATISFQGIVHGDAIINSCCITIDGKVYGDVVAEIDPNDEDAHLIIGPGANIEGDLIYSSSIKAEISDAAVIMGDIKWEEVLPDKGRNISQLTMGKFLSWLISIRGYLLMNILVALVVFIFTVIPFPTVISIIILSIMFLISGNIILLFTKEKASQFEKVLDKQLLPSMGVGFIIFLLGPIIILVMLLTFVAVPLGVLLMLLFGVAAFFGGIYTTLFVGRKLMLLMGASAPSKPGNLYYSLGTVILSILIFVPFLGYIISTLLLITGMGGLYLCYFNRNRTEFPSESNTDI